MTAVVVGIVDVADVVVGIVVVVLVVVAAANVLVSAESTSYLSFGLNLM